MTTTAAVDVDRVRARLEEQLTSLADDMDKGALSHTLGQDLVDQISNALERLDDGRYGTCEVCDNPIEQQRLAALPHITICLACKRSGGEPDPGNPVEGPATAVDAERPPSAPAAATASSPSLAGSDEARRGQEPVTNGSRPTDRLDNIDASLIDFAPDRDMGDITELVRSIMRAGLLQRPLVRLKEDGRYEVIVGRRRMAAMQALKWDVIPVEIRDFTPQEAGEAALIENLHRKDITPIEEARGYYRLKTEFGLKQQDIAARVARPQGTVSKRLALLALPDQALDAITAGDVTLQEAEHLLRLKDHPKRMHHVWSEYVGAKEDGYYFGGFEQSVDLELAEVKREQTRKKAIAELESKGIKVLDKQPSSYGAKVKEAPIGRSHGDLNVNAGKHESEPCHAAYIDPISGKAKPACTDVKRHTTKRGKSELKGHRVGYEPKERTLDDHATEQQKAKERKQALDSLVDRRKEAAKEIIAGNNVRSDEATELFAAFVAITASWFGEADVHNLVKLLPVNKPRDIAGFVGAEPHNNARVLFAYAVDQFEWDLEGAQDDDEDWKPYRPYFSWLEGHGYELHPLEYEQLGELHLLENETTEGSTSPNKEASDGDTGDGA